MCLFLKNWQKEFHTNKLNLFIINFKCELFKNVMNQFDCQVFKCEYPFFLCYKNLLNLRLHIALSSIYISDTYLDHMK